MKTPFRLSPLLLAGQLYQSFVALNGFIQAKADAKLKEMLNPAPDPKLQELFKQAQAFEQAAAEEAQALLTADNATDAMVHTAETTEQAAEVLTDAAENGEAPAAMAHTAEAVAETAETALQEPPLVANHSKKLLISRLLSSTATSLKALPGKLFLLAMLAYHHEHNRLSNINLYFTAQRKKVVVVEIGANDRLKRFKIEMSPGNQLKFLDDLPFDRLSNDLMPSFAGTTSLVGRLFSPLTGLFYPKVNERRLYHVTVKDATDNPFLANGPLIKTIELSADETLRVTHMSMLQPGHAHQRPAQLEAAADEEVEEKSPEDELDNIHLIDIAVRDNELVKYQVLPDLSGNGEIGYVKITQKLLA